ncbi:hypothetical protein PGT21_021081 [Puccinia graminis f. sp. tritici]|uniref:Uncharacterized protein n=1 Tax=Puccinia graminis f. sp. tritici TaxID=56615 RepID=A0A5B0PK74_PUCGR|nr:hypothetical protein PGT21_021081 [Puccinia graminis f. sp. tritici]
MSLLSTKRHSSIITSRLRQPNDRTQPVETATANQQQHQQQQTTKRIQSSSSHLRRRSEAQVILSHPIISRSIQDLHNQPTGNTHPQTRNSQLHPKPPSARSSAILIPNKSHRASTVTIKHGLPSPPTTIGSENGSIPGPKPTTHSETNRAPNRFGSVNGSHSERRVAATRAPSLSNQSTINSTFPRPTRTTQYSRTPTISVPAPPSSFTAHKSVEPPNRTAHTRISQHSSISSTRNMKPSKRDSLPGMKLASHTTDFNPIRPSTDPSHPRPPPTSASLASKLNQSNNIRQSPTPSRAHQRLAPISRRSSTADGRMSSHSSYSEFTTSSNHPQSVPQDTPTTELSTSLLSNATVKPHRTPSESSSTDLRPSKFKLKDRSKDPSVPALNEESCGLPRSKRLIGMKERNERIFASINASLNSPPRTHPPEPSLPPPPPSTSSGSSNSSSSSLPPSSPKRSSGNLRVPGSHHIRSGLIPFAKGCSPSPRKITATHGSQSQASNGRSDDLPTKSIDPEPEGIDDDEKYGSVRHKRPERSRLVKRTSPAGNSEVDSMSPPHSERTKTSHRADQGRRQIDAKTEQYLREATDPPTSGDIAQSHRNSRTWSESISMHTSSSDTIGARDSRTATRSASKSSAVDSQTNSSRHPRTSRYWEDEQNDSDDHDEGEDETMTTPVKVRRSESFQKTLRNASSVTEMLNSRGSHVEAASVSRTAKGPVGRRRRSSSSKGEGISELNGLPLEDSPPRLSNTLNQSPQSNRSISRRQRPGLPDHFVQPHHSERAGSERIPSLAEIRRLEPQSSLSPRSNRTRPSTGLLPQQTSDSRSHRHSDTFAIVPDRLNGVESALSRYDGHHIHSSGTRHQSTRNKHASWSGLDDVGGDLIRSQSVLGGVYDPHTVERRGTPNRHRTTFPSPISRRTIVYHHNGVDDDDDGQTSTTTYTNTQSMPRKADSAGSRSRTSEWALEDHQDSNPRSVRASSRMGGNSLILSPSRSRLIGERDRTLRGNGGAAVPQPKPFAQLLRNTYQDKNSPSHNADNRSSSSGASSKLLQSQRALVHRQLSSAKLNDSLNRSTRPPTRATSSTAGGLTALLSPTPTVDHHRLLISAYEALDHTPDNCSPETNELNSALNGLLSSVVKNSCKIDASLAELNESSVNHQVEMELVDDYIDGQADENETYSKREPPSGQVTKQKYRMMKDNLAHMSKVQGQLVRSSNDQIRDLTEVLICLSKLQRSQKEHSGARQQPSRASVIDDSRDSYAYGEAQHGEIFRSGSRASKKYSHSHSPSKLRHIVDLSPLSVISSNDESPLSRAKPNGTNEPSRHSVNNHSGRAVKSPNGFGPQHQRASTISFTHNRELSFDGVNYQQVRAKNRMSAMSSASICRMGESFYQASNGSASQPRRQELHPDIDEFGLYRKASEHTLRSPAEPKDHHPRPESAWSRAETTAGHTIRGSQSSMIFPKTPPRLPTSSISQTTAHSNVSPTNPVRHFVDNQTPHSEMNSKHPIRPQSSMSKILHRANSVLSRVEHYPAVSTLPSGRKQTQEAWDRCSREPSIDDSRPPSRHPPEPPHSHSRSRQPSQPAERTHELQSESPQRQAGHRRTGPPSRSSTMATTALERLSRIGNRSRIEQYHDEQEDVDQLHGLRRSSTSSYLASSGPECDDELDQHQHRPFNPSSSSASSSSAAFNSHLHHHHSNQKYQTNHNLNQSTTDHHNNNSTSMTTTNTNTTSNSNSSTGLPNHLGSASNHRRRKGSIQSLFNGLKRSSTTTFVKK